MGTNWSRGSSAWTWGRTSSLWGWRSTGRGCPGRLWSLLLWRYSRPTWTRSCAAFSRCPCFDREIGLDDPQRSLPTPNILWFCDSPRWRSERWSDKVYCSSKLFRVKRWEQGRAIKVITNVEWLLCREWLRKLGLSSLGKRWLGSWRALQTVSGMDINRDWLFTVLSSTRRMGHQVKWGGVSSTQTKRGCVFMQWVKGM